MSARELESIYCPLLDRFSAERWLMSPNLFTSFHSIIIERDLRFRRILCSHYLIIIEQIRNNMNESIGFKTFLGALILRLILIPIDDWWARPSFRQAGRHGGSQSIMHLTFTWPFIIGHTYQYILKPVNWARSRGPSEVSDNLWPAAVSGAGPVYSFLDGLRAIWAPAGAQLNK